MTFSPQVFYEVSTKINTTQGSQEKTDGMYAAEISLRQTMDLIVLGIIKSRLRLIQGILELIESNL